MTYSSGIGQPFALASQADPRRPPPAFAPARMLITTTQVKELVEAHIEGARVVVTDLTGTSDHFGIEVVSEEFAGKSPIDRHKMVHAALTEHLGGAIHAVQIKASTP